MGRGPRCHTPEPRPRAVIVADTSAWVEFLRGTGHPVARAVRELITNDADLAVTEVILMELLAGVRPGPPRRQLRSTLLSFPLLTLQGLADFEEAAVIYRSCNGAGDTLRSLSDCLIAVPAIRARAEILHRDRDFDAIARHTSLKVHRSSQP